MPRICASVSRCPPRRTAQEELIETLRRYQFEPLAISRVVDAERQLAQTFDRDFPLMVRFYSFPAYRQMLGEKWLNWHSHLELIVPITGAGRFRAGDHVVDFQPGDVLLVDNLKLHGMLELDGEHRSLVIYFMPELVYRAGACECDAAFLSPFWERADAAEPILRSSAPLAAAVHRSIAALVEAFFGGGPADDRRLICKLRMLELLYGLRQHFENSGGVGAEYTQRRRRLQRLQALFQFLNAHTLDKLRVREAASMVGMSETRFKGFFKEATGTMFARYVVQLRLGRACELLRDSDLSIGEIAQRAGFCDQSHLDNHFRKAFALRPREYRATYLAGARDRGRFIQGVCPKMQDVPRRAA